MLRELVSTDQVDGLVKGAVDIGLLRPIVGRPGIVSRPLMRDRLVVALPADSDLPSGDGPLRLRALEGQPLMVPALLAFVEAGCLEREQHQLCRPSPAGPTGHPARWGRPCLRRSLPTQLFVLQKL